MAAKDRQPRVRPAEFEHDVSAPRAPSAKLLRDRVAVLALSRELREQSRAIRDAVRAFWR